MSLRLSIFSAIIITVCAVFSVGSLMFVRMRYRRAVLEQQEQMRNDTQNDQPRIVSSKDKAKFSCDEVTGYTFA